MWVYCHIPCEQYRHRSLATNTMVGSYNGFKIGNSYQTQYKNIMYQNDWLTLMLQISYCNWLQYILRAWWQCLEKMFKNYFHQYAKRSIWVKETQYYMSGLETYTRVYLIACSQFYNKVSLYSHSEPPLSERNIPSIPNKHYITNTYICNSNIKP